MERRPREPGADSLAEASNTRAENLGLVERIPRGDGTDDERVDKMESGLPVDYRANVAFPRDGAPPAKHIVGR